MIPVWPADELSLPLRDDFSRAGQDPRVKSLNDIGPSSYRRRYSLVPKLITFSMFAVIDQVDRFWRFRDEECLGGTLAFWMADPQRDGRPILLADGSPLLNPDGVPYLQTVVKLYKFGEGKPTETPRGIDYKLSFNLEEMP